LGETIVLDSEAYAIIGVLPQEAVFVGNTDAWIPLATTVDTNPGGWYLRGIGRLNAGVSVDEARMDLERIHKSRIDSRSVNAITSPVVLPILERFVGDYRQGTTVLLAAVALVLLMACGNVAGLMLARAKSREHELAVRLALGAARARIVRQLLTESLLLTLIGGGFGAWLGHSALRVALARLPREIPGWIHFELDARFLAFSLVVIVAATIVSGLVPAFRASRTDIQQALRASSFRTSAGPAGRLGSRLLIVGEVSLALILLVGAGFMVQSFRAILDVDPGFRPEGVLTYKLSLPSSDYATGEARDQLFERHLEQLEALPGVLSAGAVNTAPLGTHEGRFFQIENAAPRDPDSQSPVVLVRAVAGRYFDAMGASLLMLNTLIAKASGRVETESFAT